MDYSIRTGDQFLLAELQAGEEKAFDFLFRKYYKALCAQANLYTKELEVSQSLVQECFIKFWEKRDQATTITNLSAYLSFMVRNRCVDYTRKKKKQADLQTALEGPGWADTSVTPDLSWEFQEILIQALANLPERCREAFEYSRFEGLTYPQIAEKMNISVKAVEALMSRALKSLRVELKEYLPLAILLLFL